jgi:hypothetical protein
MAFALLLFNTPLFATANTHALVEDSATEAALAQSSATSTAAESRSAAEPVTETRKSNKDYRSGVLRLGGFFITNISTKLGVSARGKPIGGLIDLNDDLGMEDSVVSPRIAGSYRFGKRHGITFGYYKLDLDGTRTLSKTIDLGPIQIPINTTIRTEFEQDIFKLTYNYIFHDEGKVTLGFTPGLYVTQFRIGLDSTGLTTPTQASEKATARCPCSAGG